MHLINNNKNSVYDEKVDIYSFGILALELMYGVTPFDEFPALKLLLSKMNYPCPDVKHKHDKKMSKALYAIVARCVDKDPKQRPTANELLEETIFKGTKSRAYLKGHLTKFAKEDMSVMGEGSENIDAVLLVEPLILTEFVE